MAVSQSRCMIARSRRERRAVGRPEHSSTLTSMINLAGVFDSQGKYQAAEEMYRRALELTEKTLGPEHPSTLTSICMWIISH